MSNRKLRPAKEYFGFTYGKVFYCFAAFAMPKSETAA
jgi:hypothetical protein